jgi:hypothetical protein
MRFFKEGLTTQNDRIKHFFDKKIEDVATHARLYKIIYKNTQNENGTLLLLSPTQEGVLQDITNELLRYHADNIREHAGDACKNSDCTHVAAAALRYFTRLNNGRYIINGETISTKYNTADKPPLPYSHHVICLFEIYPNSEEEELTEVYTPFLAVDFTAGYTMDGNKGDYDIFAIQGKTKEDILKKLRGLTNSEWS